jgi:hypothetical protein
VPPLELELRAEPLAEEEDCLA